LPEDISILTLATNKSGLIHPFTARLIYRPRDLPLRLYAVAPGGPVIGSLLVFI